MSGQWVKSRVNLPVQSEYGKIQTRKTPYWDKIQAVCN